MYDSIFVIHHHVKVPKATMLIFNTRWLEIDSFLVEYM
jgi:hypothetical protein